MGADGFAYQANLAGTRDDHVDMSARLDAAANGLADTAPHLSTRGRPPLGQVRALQLCSACLGVAGLLAPALMLAAVYYLLFAVFTALICWRGWLAASTVIHGADAAEISEPDRFPPYTILVALHDEARAVPGLIAALKALDYPPSQLDIKLLLEADDIATHNALLSENLPPQFEVHRLADGLPRTKPRALNYGLATAHGKFVTIYDAEDRPHPQQLKAAVSAFRREGSQTACVQAPLRAHNAGESWLAGQWALEYDIQFGLLLPALARGRWPIPLGGTSNHFRRSAILEAGGWDAWNVTEDADLGLRFARNGWRVGVIAPPTLEEAPERLGIWAPQRSRWIKGFLQTWLVLMRAPAQVTREMGWRNFAGMQLTLGGAILSAILAGPMAIWLIACIFLPGLSLGAPDLALLLSGYAVNAAAALAAPGKFSPRRLITILTLPLYWPLLTLGAARGIYGLVKTPHFWAKTPHGLTASLPCSPPDEETHTCWTGSSLAPLWPPHSV